MVIIEDSRQQKGKHNTKEDWFETRGINIERCKLIVGDYALPPTVSIDTKKDMAEIAGNIGGSTQEHNRFRNELMLAQKMRCKLYVLVENYDGITDIRQVKSWENPRRREYPNAISGDRLYKAMCTMENRYGVTFLFCHPQDAANIIYRILKQEQDVRDGSQKNTSST